MTDADADVIRRRCAARIRYLSDLHLLMTLAAENLSRFDAAFRVEQIAVRVDLIEEYLRERAKAEAEETDSLLSFILMAAFAAGVGVYVAPLLAEFLAAGAVHIGATVSQRLGGAASVSGFSNARAIVNSYLANEKIQSVIQETGSNLASGPPAPPPTRPRLNEGERIRNIKHVADIIAISLKDHERQLTGLRALWAEMVDAGEWNQLAAALSDANNGVRAAVARSQQIVGSAARTNPIIESYEPPNLAEVGPTTFGLSAGLMATRAEQLASHWALVLVSLSTDPTKLYSEIRNFYANPFDMQYGPGYRINGQRVMDRLVLADPTTTALTRVLHAPPDYSRSFAEVAWGSKIQIVPRPFLSFVGGVTDEDRARWLLQYRRETAARLLAQALSVMIVGDAFKRVLAFVAQALRRR